MLVVAQFSIQSLLTWLDNVHDVVAMVYEPAKDSYVAFPRGWLKERAYKFMSE